MCKARGETRFGGMKPRKKRRDRVKPEKDVSGAREANTWSRWVYLLCSSAGNSSDGVERKLIDDRETQCHRSRRGRKAPFTAY